jgi:hypothetical protein
MFFFEVAAPGAFTLFSSEESSGEDAGLFTDFLDGDFACWADGMG